MLGTPADNVLKADNAQGLEIMRNKCPRCHAHLLLCIELGHTCTTPLATGQGAGLRCLSKVLLFSFWRCTHFHHEKDGIEDNQG